MRPMNMPSFYQDELLYGYWARWYQRSGCSSFKDFYNNVFAKGKRISHELTNQVQPWVWEKIGPEIICHTLVGYYTRYANNGHAAWRKLSKNRRYTKNMLNNTWKIEKHLKYCPDCVQKERQQYGECYWHLTCQIPGVCFCPVHGTILNYGSKKITKKHCEIPVPAELAIPAEVYKGRKWSAREEAFQRYLLHINESPLLWTGVHPNFVIHRFLPYKYMTTGERSVRYLNLTKDLIAFYRNTAVFPDSIQEYRQVQNIFSGRSHNVIRIIEIGFYLNIPFTELANPSMHDRKKRDDALTDREKDLWMRIFRKHEGQSYTQICNSDPENKMRIQMMRKTDPEWTGKHMPERRRSRKKEKQML